MFNAVRLRYSPGYDVGTAVYHQLEPTLAASQSQIFSQECMPGYRFDQYAFRVIAIGMRGRHARCSDYSPATSMRSRQWSLDPHSSTELRACTVTLLWKPREAKA